MGIKNVKKNKFRKKFGINFYKKIIWEKILEKKIFFGEKNVNNIFYSTERYPKTQIPYNNCPGNVIPDGKTITIDARGSLASGIPNSKAASHAAFTLGPIDGFAKEISS